MSQQINLYQPIFRHQKKVFSSIAMAQVAAIVALGLLLIYGYGLMQVRELEQRVAQLETRGGAAQTRLEALQRQYPARVRDKRLEAELSRVQQELGYTQRLADKLSSGTFGNTVGLSSYLEGLARQHTPGTWLTAVHVGNGGSAIGVRGHAVAPELVPVYVQRLSGEAAFAGKAFSDLRLSRGEELGVVDFEVRTQGLTLDGGGGG